MSRKQQQQQQRKNSYTTVVGAPVLDIVFSNLPEQQHHVIILSRYQGRRSYAGVWHVFWFGGEMIT